MVHKGSFPMGPDKDGGYFSMKPESFVEIAQEINGGELKLSQTYVPKHKNSH
jgi:hypothetical protein